MVAVLFIVFLGCVMLRMPIAFSLGFSSFVYIAASDIPLSIIPERMFSGIDSFVILCVPGFILAGNLMNVGGITERISSFAWPWSAISAAAWHCPMSALRWCLPESAVPPYRMRSASVRS